MASFGFFAYRFAWQTEVKSLVIATTLKLITFRMTLEFQSNKDFISTSTYYEPLQLFI
jgi:hypothetical protein